MSKMQAGSDLVFFLGAGASVKAGVPDTFRMVDDFRKQISDTKKNLSGLDQVIDHLKKWKSKTGSGEVDIELLLETLERLAHWDQEVILGFFEDAEHDISAIADNLGSLKDDLKDFIKKCGIVQKNDIRYLQHLLGFLVTNKPLDIFSVNYDICIEQFCIANKKSITDGFDSNWNSKLLERTDVDVRLFKLHGSVLWYRVDNGDYVKIAVQHPGSKLICGRANRRRV